MVLEFLNELKSKVSKEEYKIIFSMTIEDIRFNRTSFGIKTSPGDFIEICKMCQLTLSRCNGGIRA